MPAPLTSGDGVPDDTLLRLCGEVGGGKRVLELGVSETMSSLVVAEAGGKAIAVDPDPARLRRVREDATAMGLHVECHQDDVADLGFLPSGSVELVIADHTVSPGMDLGRVLRQVHRVLRPSAVFVMSLDHPFAAVSAERGVGYGQTVPTIGDWLMLFGRTNFRIERLGELGVGEGSVVPTTLLVRARKEGS